MKHGANNLSLIEGNMPNIDQKIINKCLDVLLQEVNTGDFEDFRRLHIQKNTSVIDLKMGKAENIDLKQLGEALHGTKVKVLNLNRNKVGAEALARLGEGLKGTQVHTLVLNGNNISDADIASLGKTLKGTQIQTLNLAFNNIRTDGAASLGAALKGTEVHSLYLGFNNIGADGAARLCEALKGTQVHTLDLWGNNIGADDVAGLAACIPGTLLLKVHLGEKYPVLTKALEKNAQKIMVTPYYLAHLAHHFETNQSEIAPTNELDIFMCVGKDIQGHILSLFPLMTSKMVSKYQQIPAERQENAFSFCTIS